MTALTATMMLEPRAAAGFLAGRGIWGSALAVDLAETERIARGAGRATFVRCREMAERVARPLTDTAG